MLYRDSELGAHTTWRLMGLSNTYDRAYNLTSSTWGNLEKAS